MIRGMKTHGSSMMGLLLGGALLVSPSPAQTKPSERPGTRPFPVRSHGVLQKKDLSRIVFIGASVSDGFGNGLPPSVLAQRVLKDRGFKILRFTSSLFFMQPLKIGPLQMRRALKAKPTLLIGIDFLFWFGYGWMNKDARMKRLEKGLALLDQFPGKILVGNLPDMHGADPRMLAPRQIPAVGTLKTMNDRIAQWVKKRPRVRLFDLSAHVDRMRKKGIVLPSRDKRVRPRRISAKELMSKDRLHPSKQGVRYLLHLVLGSLERWGGSALKASLAWDFAEAMKD